MGAINDAFNRAGWSILSLASATAKYRARRNEEGKNRAKLNYSTAATIKKQNNELTKKQSEPPKSYFDINSPLPNEIDEQKIAEQKVLEQMAKEKAKATSSVELAGVEALVPKQATSFSESADVEALAPKQKYIPSEEDAYLPIKAENTETELPTVSAERSETNISAKDPEVQGLIQAKQKNALRAASSKRSQERYQNIKAHLTSTFADYSNIDDVWREISLDPSVTDEMIRKAGFTKAQILEEWNNYKNSPSDWMQRQNIRGDEYGIIGNESDAEDFSSFGNFGSMLSAYIKAKAGGKTLKQQLEEHELSKFSPEEEENYKVWQDESTEEETDEEKKDKGILF